MGISWLLIQMKNCIVIILIMMQCYSTFAVPFSNQYGVEKRRKWCGQKLSDQLSLVCQRIYNTPSKKALNDIVNDSKMYEEGFFGNDNEIPGYWFPPSYESLLTNYKTRKDNEFPLRKNYGIVDECCLHSCSREQLMSYCGA